MTDYRAQLIQARDRCIVEAKAVCDASTVELRMEPETSRREEAIYALGRDVDDRLIPAIKEAFRQTIELAPSKRPVIEGGGEPEP